MQSYYPGGGKLNSAGKRLLCAKSSSGQVNLVQERRLFRAKFYQQCREFSLLHLSWSVATQILLNPFLLWLPLSRQFVEFYHNVIAKTQHQVNQGHGKFHVHYNYYNSAALSNSDKEHAGADTYNIHVAIVT